MYLEKISHASDDANTARIIFPAFNQQQKFIDPCELHSSTCIYNYYLINITYLNINDITHRFINICIF